MTEPTSHPSEPADTAGGARNQRTAGLILALIAAIAVGIGLGFLADRGTQSSVPAADSVDVGFAQDMIEHHDQAVEMSAVALANATDPMVRDFAYDILTTQQNQIGQMTGWLSLWDQPLVASGDHMTWMGEEAGHEGHEGHEGMDHSASGDMASGAAAMPGMATSAEMAELRQARGEAVDVLFLQLMLRHHQGGLPMMEYAIEHAEEPVVRTLAETMAATQESESARMTQMLAEKGAEPLPFP